MPVFSMQEIPTNNLIGIIALFIFLFLGFLVWIAAEHGAFDDSDRKEKSKRDHPSAGQ